MRGNICHLECANIELERKLTKKLILPINLFDSFIWNDVLKKITFASAENGGCSSVG